MASRFKHLSSLILISIFLCSATSKKRHTTLVDHAKVCFLRHGTTGWTWDMIAKGSKDLSLTKEGRQNIQEATDVIIQQSNFKPQIIFCSPRKRCLETANIFQKKYKKASGRNLVIKVIEDLEGATYASWSADVTARLTQQAEEIKKLNLSYKESNELMLKIVAETPECKQEPAHDLEMRVEAAFQKIADLQEGQFLVVAHGSVFKLLEKYFLRCVTVKDSKWHTFLMFANLKSAS